MKHVVIIKTLLYTGVRVSELVNIKISDVDLDNCQIKISEKDRKKARIVPFPKAYTEVLAVHIENAKKNKEICLFESSWKRPYSDRGIRKILMNYTKKAGIDNSISPQKLRHFLFTWMKKKGVEDALIQSYSGHEKRQSFEIYSKLSLQDSQPEYEEKIKELLI
jgi:integrase/recombinase XerD